ncbi:MAG: family 16 glycoside hydrolase [Gemmataceae bacterium]
MQPFAMPGYQILIRCVGEAVAAHGLKCMLGVVPFGERLYEIANDAHNRYKRECNAEESLKQVEAIAQAGLREIRSEARALLDSIKHRADKVLSEQLNQPGVEQAFLSYFEQFPASVRATFRRPADPSGKSVPNGFSLKQPDDFLRLLPARPPRFYGGDRIADRWILGDLLGVGGFGEVWRAEHASDKSQPPVALKFCLDQDATRFLRHEAQLMQRVMAETRGPGVVELKAAHLDHNPPCLAFEYINGGDVTGLMHDWLRLPLAKRVPLAAQVVLKLARIIGPLHRMQPPIVHRDLKPANILVVRKDGGKFDVKIADFGIGGIAARKQIAASTHGVSRGDLLSQTLRGSHTPLYASPEQVRGQGPDPRDDVHALGVMWFQLLTCDLGRGVGADFDEDLRELHVPDATAAAIKRCVASRADRRFGDAQELADYMATMTHESSLPTAPEPLETAPVETLPAATTRVGRGASTQRPRRKKQGDGSMLLYGVIAGLLLVSTITAALVVTLRTRYGDVVIEFSDPKAPVEVKLDGEKVELAGLDRPLKLQAGEHGLTVTGADFETVTRSFTVKRGEKQVVQITLQPRVVARAPKAPAPEVPAPPTEDEAPPPPPDLERDWKALFNGRDLTGWQSAEGGPPPRGWTVDRGELLNQGAKADLWTTERFGDFTLEVEYKTDGNSGVILRATNRTDWVGHAAEIQIDKPTDSPTSQSNGALYGLLAPTSDPSRRHAWNTLSITAKDRAITVIVNGTKVIEADLDEWTTAGQNPDGSNNQTKVAPNRWPLVGHLGLQAHAGRIRFRNIRLRALGVAERKSVIPAEAVRFAGKAYKVFTPQLSWREASTKCEELGGNLVIIRSKEENALVTRLVDEAGLVEAWIGATDVMEEGKWIWIDGKPLVYSNWFKGQPNNKDGEEHYALLMVNRGGEWSDQPNESKQHRPGYVCQWDIPAEK